MYLFGDGGSGVGGRNIDGDGGGNSVDGGGGGL